MALNTRSKIPLIVLSGLLAAAVAVAVYLWQQNTQLRRQTQVAVGEKTPSVQRIREGDELPDFTARDTEGREVHVLARGSGNSLLFIYSPTCDRCEAGIPSWIRVSNKLKELKSSTRVLALSIEDSYTTVQHSRKMNMPFVIVPFPSIELQKKYGVTEVPLTVLVDQQGKVQAVWDKPLDEGEVGDVIETVCPECLPRVSF